MRVYRSVLGIDWRYTGGLGEKMILPRWFALLFLLCGAAAPVPAQVPGDEVDDLSSKFVAPARVRLTWKAVEAIPCVYTISYSVYRSTSADFEASDSNLLLSGVKTNSAVITDRLASSTYRVFAVHSPVSCATKPIPGYQGLITIHPFANDSGELVVSLRTKWRPDAKERGALSYVVNATYSGQSDAEVYYARSLRCTFGLELFDAQGFKVREVEINFVAMVAGEGKVTGLRANDMSELTAAQYRDFARGGDWNLGWTCPKT